MKKIISFLSFSFALAIASTVNAQQSPPQSPPAKATEKISSGATITIHYSQPSLKGRTMGENVEPMKGQVWRMGANKATVFETDKDVTIEGKKLPAGKYSMFGLWDDSGFQIIFNSAWDIWGTRYKDNADKDVIRVTVQPREASPHQELLTYTVDKSGKVTLHWGTAAVDFNVQ